MSQLTVTLLLALAVLGIALAGMGIRVILLKGGEFKGGCANNNPMLKDDIGECTVCGAKPDEVCKSDENPSTDNPLPNVG